MHNKEKMNMHILNIVENGNIREQKEIMDQLKEHGFEAPQATISRRLKKLGVYKEKGVYKVVRAREGYLPTILNMQTSDFGTIVLHIQPGHAGPLGYFLDKKYVNFARTDSSDKPIMGCIAGDDTVVLFAKNSESSNTIIEALKKDFPELS